MPNQNKLSSASSMTTAMREANSDRDLERHADL